MEQARRGHGETWLLLAAGIGAMMAARAALQKYRTINLIGKTVLITGGSRGLGLLLAREFGKQGARLALCARDPEELTRAREELEWCGAEVCTYPCDITSQEQVKQAVRSVEERFGPIDILVNNAGIIQVGPMELMTPEDYEEALRTHFWGSLYMTLEALPGMRQRRQGRIVNIASFGGKVSVPHLLPYNVSKFAQVGLSEGMRAELAKDGILTADLLGLVNRLLPGPGGIGTHRARGEESQTAFSPPL
jgi:NAD(P)-dependent dehydrogenase (short-subunit alcohol dehydrogenase family)